MSVSPRARCADFLDVVDAAFKRPGGPGQRRMEEVICPGCPIWDQCLHDALATGEHGPWGGTSERQRRKATPPARRVPFTFNIAGMHPEHACGGGVRANSVRLTELGVTALDVKQWAVGAGLATKIPRALPSLDLIEAYASAHDLQDA